MRPSRAASKGDCTQCGAVRAAGQPKCWLCHTVLPPNESVVAEVVFREQSSATGPRPAPAGPMQFSLSALLLLITVLAIVVGVVAIHPGLGIVLAVLTTPVLVCIGFGLWRRKERDRPISSSPVSSGPLSSRPMASGGTSSGRAVAIILVSVAMVVTVPLAAGVAFFFTCLASFGRGSDPVPASGIAAIAAGGLVAVGFLAALVALVRTR